MSTPKKERCSAATQYHVRGQDSRYHHPQLEYADCQSILIQICHLHPWLCLFRPCVDTFIVSPDWVIRILRAMGQTVMETSDINLEKKKGWSSVPDWLPLDQSPRYLLRKSAPAGWDVWRWTREAGHLAGCLSGIQRGLTLYSIHSAHLLTCKRFINCHLWPIPG